MKESKFQIVGQRLINSTFKINESFKKGENIKLDYKPVVEFSKDEVNSTGIVNLKLELFNEILSEHQPFYLKLEIEGMFKWDESLENVDIFLKMNAPAILLSYLRSIVIQLTTMAGFPPLNLPLINFSES